MSRETRRIGSNTTRRPPPTFFISLVLIQLLAASLCAHAFSLARLQSDSLARRQSTLRREDLNARSRTIARDEPDARRETVERGGYKLTRDDEAFVEDLSHRTFLYFVEHAD